MEIISFDIKGKFAHFRKYYSSSTALSFTLPPRTTIMGMLGAVLGIDKDEYYEPFGSDHLELGVAVKSDIKKTIHRLNHLMIKGGDDFRGRKQHIQTPMEIISGPDIVDSEIIYRIFAAADTESRDFERIKDHLTRKDIHYNLTLGLACFHAELDNIELYEKDQIVHKSVDSGELEMHSAISPEAILSLNYEKSEKNKHAFIEEDMMPADFEGNHNRSVKKMNRLVFTTGNIPLKVTFKGNYYELTKNGNKQNIQFLL